MTKQIDISVYSSGWVAPGGIIPSRLFTYLYDEIPNKIEFKGVDTAKVIDWISNDLASDITKEYTRHVHGDSNEFKLESRLFIMKNNSLIFIDEHDLEFLYYQGSYLIELMIDQIPKFKVKDLTNEVSLIVEKDKGWATKEFKIDFTETNIETNYNDDLKDVDLLIRNSLSKNTKGLVLLHGAPGTGKTNYVRHLINNIDPLC